MKAENRGQRVRGVLVVADRYTSLVSASNPDCVVAYTHWYRHDDDLSQLDLEFDRLRQCYSEMKKSASMSMHYEYQDYGKA